MDNLESLIAHHKITPKEWDRAIDAMPGSFASLVMSGDPKANDMVIAKVLEHREKPPRPGGTPKALPKQSVTPRLSKQFDIIKREGELAMFTGMMQDTGAPTERQNRRYTRPGSDLSRQSSPTPALKDEVIDKPSY